MLRPDTFALTALLGLLSAIGPISVDMYLPSFPEIGRAFGAGVPQVQLTLSGFLFCFACGQILYGPLSDQLGRKPVLLAALLLYVMATIGCALATSIEMLIALRCLQAFGVAGAPVLTRAIVRDLYEGARAGRELSHMGSIMALAPVIAPSLGGLLQTAFGWQASFVLMTATGLCAIVAVARLLPETMHRPAVGGLSFSATLRDYGGFLRHRGFLLYLAILAASYGGLFAWLSGSSFALQNFYGLSPLVFGVVFASTTLGYLAGTLLAGKLVGRIGIDRTILLGGFGLAAGGLAMVATMSLDVRSPLALALPITVYIAGLGLAMPQCMAGALTPFPGRAGSASSLLGFVQQVAASLLGIVVGQLLVSSALPLAIVIAVMGCLSLALAFLNLVMRRPHTDPRAQGPG